MTSLRSLAFVCIGSALGAIIYVGVTGHRWALSFAAIMIVGSIIIGVGEALGDRKD